MSAEPYEVVGDLPIVGTNGAGKVKGETVLLDPERTNIPALIAGGHVVPARTPAKTGGDKAADKAG